MRYFISINPKIISTIIKVKQLVFRAKTCNKKATALLPEMLGHKLIHSPGRTSVSEADANAVCQEIFLHNWPNRVMLNPELPFNAILHSILEPKLFKKAKFQAGHQTASPQYATYKEDFAFKTGATP